MIILGIETSSPYGGVAVIRDNSILADKTFTDEFIHGKELVLSIKEILENSHIKPAEIDVIAVCIGPGSYTGVRIGIACAKTLAWSLHCKLTGVSSLEALAFAVKHCSAKHIVPVIDGHRNSFYYAVFRIDKDKITRVTPDSILSFGQVINHIPADSLLTGNGLIKLQNHITASNIEIGVKNKWYPNAETIALIGKSLAEKGEFASPESLEPLYLRPSEAEAKFHVSVDIKQVSKR
ncbi:MAG: tRNA (adenosine(37)-N6)-threonylcarbamoyltransferase complex dimerization subunit type 1 TsaB [Planctomycetota bacterium]